MTKELVQTVEYPTILIVGVQTPYHKTPYIESYFEEFRNLLRSNYIAYQEELYCKIRSIDNAYFFTKGKLRDLINICEEKGIEEVIVSEPLSTQQERNLSRILHARVYDRTQLILEIFEKGAHSAEGKLQVELAMLQHKKSRLSGRGTQMSQQSGKIGTRGPGETQKEKELQHLDRGVTKLRKKLEQLHKVRHVQRKKRLTQQIPQISLVGYTNAGKSTILNTLTKSSALAEDRLFATLDTTTRELFIQNKKKGVLSDTVGFIQLLPPKLIEAFKSTLSELAYADLLLIVIDISDPTWDHHIEVVKEVLDELEINKPALYVFNKRDCIEVDDETLETMTRKYQPHVIISATSKSSIQPLISFLDTWEPRKPLPLIED